MNNPFYPLLLAATLTVASTSTQGADKVASGVKDKVAGQVVAGKQKDEQQEAWRRIQESLHTPQIPQFKVSSDRDTFIQNMHEREIQKNVLIQKGIDFHKKIDAVRIEKGLDPIYFNDKERLEFLGIISQDIGQEGSKITFDVAQDLLAELYELDKLAIYPMGPKEVTSFFSRQREFRKKFGHYGDQVLLFKITLLKE